MRKCGHWNWKYSELFYLDLFWKSASKQFLTQLTQFGILDPSNVERTKDSKFSGQEIVK